MVRTTWTVTGRRPIGRVFSGILHPVPWAYQFVFSLKLWPHLNWSPLVIDSHNETAPSLRIDKPFSALLEHAMSLDLDSLDDMDHGHIPYVVILVRAMEEWKKIVRPLYSFAVYITLNAWHDKHDGKPPQSYAEKQAFKKSIEAMKKKIDEENFDEAVAQAYRAWTPTVVPSGIAALFSDPALQHSRSPSSPNAAIFFHLLDALHRFTQQAPYTLPLSSTLPDMKSDTNNYIYLQTLYKRQAEHEKTVMKSLIGKEFSVDDETIDAFVKNAHGLRLLRGKPFGAFDLDREALGKLSLCQDKRFPRTIKRSECITNVSEGDSHTPRLICSSECTGKRARCDYHCRKTHGGGTHNYWPIWTTTWSQRSTSQCLGRSVSYLLSF